MDTIDVPGVPNCVIHGDHDSVDTCSRCDRPFCSDCLVILEGADLCRDCLAIRARELHDAVGEATNRLARLRGDLERLRSLRSVPPEETLASLQRNIDFLDRRLTALKRLSDDANLLIG